jgi:hypothetical protein
MRTIEGAGAAESRPAQVARDLRLLGRLLRLVLAYFLSGALVRRRYRQKQRRGEVFFVDEEFGR